MIKERKPRGVTVDVYYIRKDGKEYFSPMKGYDYVLEKLAEGRNVYCKYEVCGTVIKLSLSAQTNKYLEFKKDFGISNAVVLRWYPNNSITMRTAYDLDDTGNKPFQIWTAANGYTGIMHKAGEGLASTNFPIRIDVTQTEEEDEWDEQTIPRIIYHYSTTTSFDDILAAIDEGLTPLVLSTKFECGDLYAIEEDLENPTALIFSLGRIDDWFPAYKINADGTVDKIMVNPEAQHDD